MPQYTRNYRTRRARREFKEVKEQRKLRDGIGSSLEGEEEGNQQAETRNTSDTKKRKLKSGSTEVDGIEGSPEGAEEKRSKKKR